MSERWWISDGPVSGGGRKILGPFESRDLALDVRRLYEAHPDARGLTFWVSEEQDRDKRHLATVPEKHESPAQPSEED